MKKRNANLKTLSRALILLALAMTVAGCELIGGLGGLGVNGLSLLGVQPADDYYDTGNIEISMMPKSENAVTLGSLSSFGVGAEVRDEDGQMKECEMVGEETELASRFNSVALLIDDSGSMGLSYDADVCATCPHDPKNERAEAARELAGIVFDGAPDSQIAVFDFGPDADEGRVKSRVLAGFSKDIKNIEAAIELVDGTQEVGTPLWDALAETITDLNANAQVVEGERVNSEIPQEQTEGNPRTDEVKRYLIVLSDGADTESETHTLESVIELAKANNIPIYAVGLGPAAANDGVANSNATMLVKAVQDLSRLAEETGGFYASVRSAAQLRALYEEVGLAMTEGYQTATFDCGTAGNSGNTPNANAEPRHIQGNLLLGEGLITLPFGFQEPPK